MTAQPVFGWEQLPGRLRRWLELLVARHSPDFLQLHPYADLCLRGQPAAAFAALSGAPPGWESAESLPLIGTDPVMLMLLATEARPDKDDDVVRMAERVEQGYVVTFIVACRCFDWLLVEGIDFYFIFLKKKHEKIEKKKKKKKTFSGGGDWAGMHAAHWAALFHRPILARRLLSIMASCDPDRYGGSVDDYIAATDDLAPRDLGFGLRFATPDATNDGFTFTRVDDCEAFALLFGAPYRENTMLSPLYVEAMLSPLLGPSSIQVPTVEMTQLPKLWQPSDIDDDDASTDELLNACPSDADAPIVIAEISAGVGHGVFAWNDLNAGQPILIYGGILEAASPRATPPASTAAVAGHSQGYAVRAARAHFVLDAGRCRSAAALVNHSATPNARLVGGVWRGAERVIVQAARRIARGEQICIDYGRDMLGGWHIVPITPGRGRGFPHDLEIGPIA
jgi:hypothetical protein